MADDAPVAKKARFGNDVVASVHIVPRSGGGEAAPSASLPSPLAAGGAAHQVINIGESGSGETIMDGSRIAAAKDARSAARVRAKLAAAGGVADEDDIVNAIRGRHAQFDDQFEENFLAKVQQYAEQDQVPERKRGREPSRFDRANDDVPMEAFNLNSEMDAGVFADGNVDLQRLERGERDPDADDDAWLEDVTEAGDGDGDVDTEAEAAKQKELRAKLLERAKQAKAAEAARPKRSRDELCQAVAELLEDGETVTQALRRLRPAPAKKGKRGRRRAGGAAAEADGDGVDAGERAAAKAKFDRLVEAADELMSAGYVDVYEHDRATIAGEASKAPGWEFRWVLPPVDGGEDDVDVHGPHTGDEMRAWIANGCFSDERPVWVREAGSGGAWVHFRSAKWDGNGAAAAAGGGGGADGGGGDDDDDDMFA